MTKEQIEGYYKTGNIGIAGVGGGHQTDGAVDLGLCDKEGRGLDMGTQYLEHNAKTKTCCITLTEEQRRNRRILVNAMQRAGFVNYHYVVIILNIIYGH